MSSTPAPSYTGNKRRTIQQQVAAMIEEGRRHGIELPATLHQHYGQDIGRSVTEMSRIAAEQALLRREQRAAAEPEPEPIPAPVVPKRAQLPLPVTIPKVAPARATPRPVGPRGDKASAVMAAFARERGEINAAMVAEHFTISPAAARVRLWRAADRGALTDIENNRKRYTVAPVKE